MVQVMYGLMHAVQWNCRWDDGSSDVRINACSTVQLAMYWWFKWCTDYCDQFSGAGVVLVVHVMYRILHRVQCKGQCIDGSSDVYITACSSVHLACYWWFKLYKYYCLQYNDIGVLIMVQMMYKLLHAVQCNLRCIDGSSDIYIYILFHYVKCNWWCFDGSSYVRNNACSTVELALCWLFKWCTN